ncbi:MAG: TetR/AcrR family transcriptional regulator [Acidobacteriaceae bacterium]|nr:TetR/AcrR family transcriptional regulator [Acidobacteriaceae bacterium]
MPAASRLNKHQQKTEVTKKKLLRAGERVFIRRGFEAARIEEIAADAGYTRGAFYAHFETKEDLFFAMFEERASILFEELRAILDEHSGDSDQVRLFRDFYTSRIADRGWSILMLEFKLYAVRHGKRNLAERLRKLKDKLRQSFSPALPCELQLGEERTAVCRIALEALLDGLALQRAYDPGQVSEEQGSLILGLFFDTMVSAHSPFNPKA